MNEPMQFESMLFKGQLYFASIGSNQSTITPYHSLLIRGDGHCFIGFLGERLWHRRLIKECSWRYPYKEIRKAGLGIGSCWPAVRLQLTPAVWSLNNSDKDFGAVPNWSKGIGPLYPFSCQLFVEGMIPGKGVEAWAKQPIVWVDTAVGGQYLILSWGLGALALKRGFG